MIWGETSLNAVLDWFLGGSTQWLSAGSAEEPIFWGIIFRRMLTTEQATNVYRISVGFFSQWRSHIIYETYRTSEIIVVIGARSISPFASKIVSPNKM